MTLARGSKEDKMDSILNSVKKMLGIAEEYKHFDTDLIMHINSVFTILTQLGVGPQNGFRIEDETAEWTDFIPENNPVMLEAVRTYMYLRVRLFFDPPQAGPVIEVINRQVSELEWRLNVFVDPAENRQENTT